MVNKAQHLLRHNEERPIPALPFDLRSMKSIIPVIEKFDNMSLNRLCAYTGQKLIHIQKLRLRETSLDMATGEEVHAIYDCIGFTTDEEKKPMQAVFRVSFDMNTGRPARWARMS